MPPRPKFEKQEVLDAALKIVRESGEEALTARRLADELGCSTRPIFTLFQGMQDVKEQLYPVVGDFFVEFCNRYRDYMPPFKGFGIALVDFATTEPHLFCYYAVSRPGQERGIEGWLSTPMADAARKTLMGSYHLDQETASCLFKEMWLHTFALCMIKVTHAADFSDEEISQSLSRSFASLLMLAKSGGLVSKNRDGVISDLLDNPVSLAPAAPIEPLPERCLSC